MTVEVITRPAEDITKKSATLVGYLVDDGGEDRDCGFQWGLTIAYGYTTGTLPCQSTDTFKQPITGLKPGITYHFRAFVLVDDILEYGEDVAFNTLPLNITSIRHVYQRYTGVYQIELMTGGVTADFSVPNDITPASSSLKSNVLGESSSSPTPTINTNVVTTNPNTKTVYTTSHASTIPMSADTSSMEPTPSTIKPAKDYSTLEQSHAVPISKETIPDVTKPQVFESYGKIINELVAATKQTIQATWNNILEFFK